MAFMAGNITALLSIKIKARHDDYTDQVSRIIVVKIFIVSSLVMGVDFFHDTISCLPPVHRDKSHAIPPKFIQSACWIKGFYVYPELPIADSVYYGIPVSLGIDGMSDTSKQPCSTKGVFLQRKKQTHCVPLKKRYMRQYQWMPFFIASIALLFYMPYIIFRVVNTDMISLRANINDQVDRDLIVQNYFNHSINSVPKMRMRVFMNVIIKLLYLLVNVTAFMVLNSSLDHTFYTYGTEWISWTRLNSTMQLDFDHRNNPLPGNKMLPSFGICDVSDTRKDITSVYVNKAVMVCEISSHVLYHYLFLIFWFVLVLSISVSIVGLILNVCGHINNMKFSRNRDSSKLIYQHLTIRECEYLEFIRRRNLALYGVVIAKLQETKLSTESTARKPTNGCIRRKANNGITIGSDEECQPLKESVT